MESYRRLYQLQAALLRIEGDPIASHIAGSCDLNNSIYAYPADKVRNRQSSDAS